MRCVLNACLLIALVGCGGESGPEKVSVSGTVTYDGRPLNDGEIIFLPEGGSGTPFATRIEDGEFDLEVTKGRKRVEIRADRAHPTKKIDGIEPGTKIPVREQYIPARYNTESTLAEEVNEGGVTFTFDLQPDS